MGNLKMKVLLPYGTKKYKQKNKGSKTTPESNVKQM
jgi:hypothetical protein